MDNFFSDCSSITPYHFVAVAVVLFIGLYVYDTWCNRCGNSYSSGRDFGIYGYEQYNGPSVWKTRFESATGSKQSPINLQERCSICIPTETTAPLSFSNEFHTPPCEMKLYNSGHNAVLYANWKCGKRPTISGGPLCNDFYSFLNIHFRWGINDYEGTEHMINGSSFAMEFQVAFIKSSTKHCNILEAAKSGSLLVLSYLCMVTPMDNPYMEPIIASLKYIKCPMACISIEPIILSLLIPDFSRDYFWYLGSLTFPPCTEGVAWIVKPEPLLISSRQVRKFRKLNGCAGSLRTNIRPAQRGNKREIFYYD